jgi:hypothetical protein
VTIAALTLGGEKPMKRGMVLSSLRSAVVTLMLAGLAVCGRAQTSVSVPLTTSDASKINLGFFTGGSLLQISVNGTGDLVDSRYQTNPDGSLVVAATSPYTFANPGATYPSVAGFPSGDGINHFSGGGGNYDFSGSGWMFAGLQTTDTTNPLAIRSGAVVGTFSSTPTRSDWFLIGTGGTFTIPAGGASLFIAVNDSFSPDNHGAYSLNFTAVPEPGVAGLIALGCIGIFVTRRRKR